MYVNIACDKDVLSAKDKLLGALGLARRAGKLEVGGQLCEEAIRAGRVKLVFLCSDMSENSRKKLHAAMLAREVPYIALPLTKDELAAKLGKKSFAVAAALTDEGFVKIVYKALGITEE